MNKKLFMICILLFLASCSSKNQILTPDINSPTDTVTNSFENMDTNRSGFIDFDEFYNSYPIISRPSRNAVGLVFANYDTNNSNFTGSYILRKWDRSDHLRWYISNTTI